MTLPVYPNSISLTQIQTEFGGSNPISLSEYYAGGLYVPSSTVGHPLGGNVTIPSSGTISLGNFHGATKISNSFNVFSPINGSNVGIALQAIAVNSSGLFVAVGNHGTTGNFSAGRSTDGITWTTPSIISPAEYFTGDVVAVSPTTGLFVSVGFGLGNNYLLFKYSYDGITWSAASLLNGYTGSATFSNRLIVSASGQFVLITSDFVDNFYSYSSNGTTWSTPTVFSGGGGGHVAVNSSGLFVSVGTVPVDYGKIINGIYYAQPPLYRTSTNGGATWTSPSNMGGYTGDFIPSAVAVNSSGLFVAMGSNANSSTHGLMSATSTNGTSWTVPSVISGMSSTQLLPTHIVVTASGRFLAMLVDQITLAYYTMVSSNGVTWSTPVVFTYSSAAGSVIWAAAPAAKPNSNLIAVAGGFFDQTSGFFTAPASTYGYWT